MTQRNDLLVWMDLEMTGLDVNSCRIIEAAIILTDQDLNEIGPALELTVWQPDSVLERMSPYVRAMHEHSGLLERVRKSKLDTVDAEKKIMDVLTKNILYRTGHLAGNSIWQDRIFLDNYMPMITAYLHYRLVDVSTVKQLGKWWHGAQYDKPSDGKHTALFDIRQSLEELRYLRSAVMLPAKFT